MNTIKELQQGNLYYLLSVCSNQELEPLVNIITNAFTNHLYIDESYKKYKPNHKKYYKKIGDEIRLFGSDSFASIFRGEGVDYKEIVIDICKRLNVPHKNNDLVGNEKNLISLYELEKEKLTSSITSDITKTLTFIASTLLTKIHPAGAILSITQLSSPAFRVTIPCVMHLAILRQEKIRRHNGLLEKQKESYAQDDTSKTVIIAKNKDEPILSFTPISELSTQQKSKPINISESEISRLSSLIQAIPSLATANNVKNTKYMEVSINGTLAKAQDGGGGFRCFSRGDKNQITEHGRLFDSNKLSKLANFSALYNIASIVVAQEHLADINAKLDDIKNILKSVSDFQNNERESKIKGAIQYFEQVASSVANGNRADSILNQIEAKECELLGIQTHLIKDIGNLNLEKNLKDNDTFGTEGLTKSIGDFQDKIHNLYLQLLLCIRARACGWQLLTFYPGNNDLLNSRYNDIRNSINLLNNGRFLQKTDECIKNNIKRLSSIFNTEFTQNKRKLLLLDKNTTNIEGIRINISKIEKELAFAETLYQRKRNNNAKLLLKIENEQIIEVGLV